MYTAFNNVEPAVVLCPNLSMFWETNTDFFCFLGKLQYSMTIKKNLNFQYMSITIKTMNVCREDK